MLHANASVHFKAALLSGFTGVDTIINVHSCFRNESECLLTVFLIFIFQLCCSLPQDSAPRQPRDHTGNGSMFVNEAAFTSTSVNNRHVHHKRNDPSAHNCLNTLLARSNSRQPPIVKTPHSPRSDSQGWMMGTGYLYSPAGRLELQHTPSGKNYHQVNVVSCVLERKFKKYKNLMVING